MSKNPEIFVFTRESLRQRDLQVAAKAHQVTVISTLRKAASMNSGQLVQACSNGGKSLYWEQSKLEKFVDSLDLEE
ncbi:hypothetical protein I5S53_08490 [Pseudomonas juntendi]|uniref:hypothetical protein n=1 Tax=Pseudomonas TaxID=286 RepID=UPI000D88C9FA|nr:MULTISPECIES: hypothetical protein [Pseudomonas]RFQ05958.1 hypothetical protein D0O09_01910 [Pseudomonas putida]MBH3384009.1 hypothetical protein [Pseudomonas juntendi]MDW9403975.1 hypothetical protein [Pseudomonas soli]PYC04922.1 hypothetical protein DMX12_08600 [Pseudomonas sp. MB-090624]TCT98771.1 hypothetical protein EC913_104242 [Pseudomonas sp. LP_4_YM]